MTDKTGFDATGFPALDIIDLGDVVMQTEIWKPIPSLEHYEASSWGRIRSLDRVMPVKWKDGRQWTRRLRGRIVPLHEQHNDNGGVYIVCGTTAGPKLVNRLVCEAFNGPPPSERHQAAHLNGKSTDNLPSNLIWATPKENDSHKKWHGTDGVGSRNGAAILAEKDIVEIFDLFISGKSYVQIGNTFGIEFSHVGTIIRREAWSHVEIKPDVILAVNNLRKLKMEMGRETSNRNSRQRAMLKNRLLICQHCGCEFRTRNALQDTRKYCSMKCYASQRIKHA